jgi:hypothetical protein
VRECGNKVGSDRNHFRVAARPRDQVDQLIDAMRRSWALVASAPRSRTAEAAGLSRPMSKNRATASM